MSTWLLPENIADVLPSEARKIEELRRRLLDRFRSYGYEMVMPPLLEYLESLLTSGGADLRLRTFKLVDQLSGRTLGLRADITPQVARIDAHLLNRQGVTRLCYAGHVMHTRPRGLHATREPIQIGAEIYGHAGLEADLEIQELMLDALHLAGLSRIRLDLCHAGVLAALLARDAQAAARGEALYDALSGKDVPLLHELTDDLGADTRALRALPHLYGDASVLDEARRGCPCCRKSRARWTISRSSRRARRASKSPSISPICAAMLSQRRMFTAYIDGVPNAIARGGRYDKVGQAYGRARPATGFSLDLRELARISRSRRAAPRFSRPGRRTMHSARPSPLRDAGEVVIQALPGHDHVLDEFACDRSLVERAGAWVVEPR
jgi:ATP phosphoribosyltransferase regulatory subunit